MIRGRRNEPIRSEEERVAAFEEMIAGEYSDLYQRKLGEAIKNAVAHMYQSPMRQARPNPQQGDAQARGRIRQWTQEEQQTRAMYPEFDVRRESANPEFVSLLTSGVPMHRAYELMHMEEMRNAAARNAAITAGEQMAANIRARGARPSENGMSSKSAALVKNDVRNLSREDRAELVRRAQRGETIQF